MDVKKEHKVNFKREMLKKHISYLADYITYVNEYVMKYEEFDEVTLKTLKSNLWNIEDIYEDLKKLKSEGVTENETK